MPRVTNPRKEAGADYTLPVAPLSFVQDGQKRAMIGFCREEQPRSQIEIVESYRTRERAKKDLT